jgi:hypothetical protein
MASGMYGDGVMKGFLAILAALVIVVVITFWQQTLFLLRFVWDLIVMNVVPAAENVYRYLRDLLHLS